VACAALLAAGTAETAAPTLATYERGSGEPAIVLIHGLGQDHSLWDRVAPKLAERHRLILVDLPGHGASEAIATVSVGSVAEALDRALAKLKVKRAVLVGHSYGGLVALEEATGHADRAAGVVSIDLATYTQLDSGRVANLETVIRDRYPLFIQGVFGPMTRNESQVDSVIERAGRVPQAVMSAYFRDAWHADLRPRVKKLKAPVLVVTTDVTWNSAESWTSARKRLGYETAGPATGRRIWESGHLIPIDQPDTLALAIEDFAATIRK
jgi:pimeloyl-ACP methyl ester carboxylesterase